ncbi:MAG: hypothetical protein GY803_01305 [Chloroflexi bacterium]|nr:hypothetical protein [Chloroflexota bacterium]
MIEVTNLSKPQARREHASDRCRLQLYLDCFPYLPPLVAAVAFALAFAFWSVGVQHYQSSGT